jgi:hypothetical protein
MTDHPCKGMTKAQIETFEQIAVGNALPPMSMKQIKALEANGVIHLAGNKILRDEMGSFSLPQYEVPIPVHMQWCKWCSEQPENQEV